MKNKKILIVSHQFLPHISPRTTRWSLLIDELIDRGHEVTVLSGTKPDNIQKKYKHLYFGNKEISSNISRIRKNSQNSSNGFIKKIIYSVLKKIYRFIFKTFSWPDYAMLWVITILKNKKHIKNDYDVIISVSLPFTSHLCAYIIHKKIQVDWFMDIGDPFTLKLDSPENNKFIYSFLNNFYERKFYQTASKIIFTHEEVAKLHQSKFNIDSTKITIGYPIASISKETITIARNFNYALTPFKIGYFGAFTKSVRDPKNYLSNIANHFDENFEHEWYINEESKKFFNSVKNVSSHKFHDIVPREQAIKVMTTEIHVLLSIGNLNKYQLPSKVFEYLSLGKPVLHFAEIREDPLYKFESSFENLNIINAETTSEEIKMYFQNIKKNNFNLNINYFEDNFSASKLLDDLI